MRQTNGMKMNVSCLDYAASHARAFVVQNGLAIRKISPFSQLSLATFSMTSTCFVMAWGVANKLAREFIPGMETLQTADCITPAVVYSTATAKGTAKLCCVLYSSTLT